MKEDDYQAQQYHRVCPDHDQPCFDVADHVVCVDGHYVRPGAWLVAPGAPPPYDEAAWCRARAQAGGQAGGRNGGLARAAALTAARRSEIARLGGLARWRP